jgi:D-3-phosphoglycerate dehydrogenase
MSKKILITPKSFGTYKSKAYPLLQEKGYEVVENTLGRTMTEQEILEIVKQDVVGIIVGVDPITANILEQSEELAAVSKYGVGMDNIDLAKAKELGISVKNAVGTNNISVAEQAIALMFSITRNIPSISKGVKDGGWGRVIGCELTGKKLGIIGGGQIGKEVAKRARGLEMNVSIYDPYFNDEAFLCKYEMERCLDLDQLFAESDIISLHIPATPDTKGIINKETLKLMKPTSYIINTSRGELINEEDLYEALSNKTIAGAAQDVFSSEPPVKGEKLLELDNFILTPHIGAFTREAVERMVMVSTMNLLDMLEEKNNK